MAVIPCSLCGYHAPAALCPHCGGRSTDPALSARRGRAWRFWAGISALPRGLGYLATTPGTKRWLLPPFLITTTAFTLLLWWAWRGFERLVAYAQTLPPRAADFDAAWWERAIEAALGSWLFAVIAKLGGALLFAVLGFFAALYVFSLFYEAISGPFLDSIQGRIEERWFGVDPRNALQRPTAMSSGRCAAYTILCTTIACAALLAAWNLEGGRRWWILLAALFAPFLTLGLGKRDFGRWLVWAVRVEGSTLWTSVRTSLLVLLLLVLCLPLKFVPLVGPLLFAGAAGFATAISLLDIPFSRRGWSVGQRLHFFAHSLLPLAGFGSMASLLFLIPFLGPILMVPAASIGGLWLLVRLDKSRLRQLSAVRAARLAAR